MTRRNLLGGAGNTALWSNKLEGVPCFIIGNAPSLNKVNLSLLENCFTIGINRAFLSIDTTILIWQDYAIWNQYKKKLQKLKSIKYCRKGACTSSDFWFFNMSGRESKITMDPSHLYGRGSSGPLSYQLAYALGCNPIVLLGMDCRYDKKGNTDFYGKNSMHREHTLPSCVKGLKWIRKNKHGKTVYNCSKNNVFEERFKLEEVLEKCGDKVFVDRKEIIKKLSKKY
ncbi:MAG TPA: hypothetical protein VMZ91_16465 [Candidatus Paceibacterota bacterium]|nr:hypothetical protein [Candidatus Paceibacterota bacterium]